MLTTFTGLQTNSGSLKNKLYAVAGLAIILAWLATIFFISIQPFENPVEVTMKFLQSFDSKSGNPYYFLTGTARKHITPEQSKSIESLAKAFKESDITVPPIDQKDGFWQTAMVVTHENAGYKIYYAKVIGGWKIKYIRQLS